MPQESDSCVARSSPRLIITSAAVTLLVGPTGCSPVEPPSTANAAQSTPKAETTPKPASKPKATPKTKPASNPKATPKPAPKPMPKRKPGVTATVNRWVDGDTVDTSRGTIRLIVVDTPEKGRCGAATATNAARRWAPVGSTVRLVNPSSVVDTDRYGRSLRYVVRGDIDVSRAQIVRGADARYDSTDGYQWHPRQTSYHAADRAHRDYQCSSKPSRSRPGSAAPISEWDCPSRAPIKGNDSSMIYHMPWNPVLRRHHARVVLRHRTCGRSGWVPSSEGLTGWNGSDLRSTSRGVGPGRLASVKELLWIAVPHTALGGAGPTLPSPAPRRRACGGGSRPKASGGG